jgi:hypothetical protein
MSAHPQSRLGPDDEGNVCMAVAADPARGVVRVTFEHPVAWMAFDARSARLFADHLRVCADKVDAATN